MSQPSPFLIRSTNHLRFLALAASQPSPSHCQPRPTSALKRPNPQRYLSSSSPLRSSSAASEQTPVSEPSASQSRWLSNTKSRLGKCILWGLTPDQTQRAAKVLKVLGEDWRALVAEQEGFLTSEKRAGLLRHKVVWGEMDSMAHVNNVTYVRYAESARINWAYNYAVHVDPKNQQKWSELWTPKGDGLILRSMRTDYKFPMTWPDHICVFHKLHSLPKPTDTSFILDVMILSELHQRPAARCVEDIVVYDYRKGKKMALPPFVMDAFTRTWEEQEGVKRAALERIKGIEDEVRKLEMESWDREGAVEQVGVAS